MAALTTTAASVSTTAATESHWTWSPPAARWHAPGSPACATSWPASVMRTAWLAASAPGTKWLKQTFDEADKNGDGSLSVSEVLRLLHKLNVNLPRQRVKQMFREADTDDHQGTLGFEEFCAFYKMMSTRRDLYLLMLTYSNHKDHLDAAGLQRFLQVEQKMTGVTLESCQDIIEQFEPCPENRSKGLLGIDGFTNYTRSPAGDIFNPEHHCVHQDMTRPLSHYFITSSHNTYLVGDQLMSQSRVDMYAWVLQAGCRCVEVDCWDGPDGEPIVHHGYTLTSKILFKDVIETINKYAFIKNEYPVILSIENHCSVIQQKKMAQYLTGILGDKLDLSSVSSEDATTLPSPQMLKGKILVKGKKLPANISEDAEEGEVSDEDSADEIDDDCKLLNGDESKIRDCEDPNDFSVSTLSPSGKLGRKSKAEEDVESGEYAGASRRNSRLVVGNFSRRKKKGSKLKKAASVDEGQDSPGGQSRGTARQKKTMQLSRALSDLVKYTKSVATHDIEVEAASSWQVSSFSETKAQQILQQKPVQYLRFNQQQLSRIYPSSYRVDSSNYNPQPFWNAGCQMVALNYQSEGRMLQLNRAKFSANGGCGYVLKPECMCQGMFNPNSEDPLPGQLKKQLVLRIISGQQLPKPRDSMLGDRGEIIDPFVEVEVIGLPVDCSREQTRVVDDNGFNPTWEETLVFTVHMPEIALVRFLVWDHDPIGRDFIGQRTLAFSSMMPGYRHVYLEGMEEASIFVHVAVSDISGKVKQALGLKGLFLRGPKPGSLDSHAAGRPLARPSVSQRFLRRTASAPTKSLKPGRKGFPELVLGTQDSGSKGAADDMVPPSPGPAPEALAQEGPSSGSPRGKVPAVVMEKSPVCVRPPCAPEGLGPAGMAATCMKCVVGSCAGVNTDGLRREWPPSLGPASRHAAIHQQPQAREDSMGAPCSSLDPQVLSGRSREAPKGPGAWGQGPGGSGSMSSDASSPDSPGSPEVGARWPEGACRQPGALQGEMSALFAQKLEDIRSKSPMFSADTRPLSTQRPLPALCSLETIAEEPTAGPGPPPPAAVPANSSQEWPPCPMRPGTNVASPPEDPEEPRNSRPRPCHGRGPSKACEGAPSSQTDGRSQPRTLGPLPMIRRVKSEGQVPTEPLAGPFLAPAMYSDATGSDRLWQRLEPHGHRDSVSSSSSMSSSDTVIDLSMPSLGLGCSRESLTGGPVGRLPPRPHLASAAHPDLPRVTKSKSNPNLRAAGQRPPTPEDLRPGPLAPRMPGLPLRPPWGRLSPGSLQDCPVAAKSKSLGDLTADDFAPSSEGGSRSLSHSLGLPGGARQVLGAGVRRDILTEQLRWLTVFQQAGDITSPTSLGVAGDGVAGVPGFLRRSSSRSQSRVRAIASRARQAQERQHRLQGQGRGRQGPPEEERGTPEGACSVGHEGRVDVPAPSKGAPGPASVTAENLVLLRL
ncbi:1-phosphatidylinositol 4,5-bisphosphate phosphodiesterase eta-2 isoform X8 [Callithrix jacchus]